jgi:hypothetical protein
MLPSLSLIDMIYFLADTKATPASVQCVGVYFEFDMNFVSPERLKRVRNRNARFHCVFGSTDGYEI